MIFILTNCFSQSNIENDTKHVRKQKGKSQQNAVIERFNKAFIEDVLDSEIFKNVEQEQFILLQMIWLKIIISSDPINR